MWVVEESCAINFIRDQIQILPCKKKKKKNGQNTKTFDSKQLPSNIKQPTIV